jgi:hypothetical protein
MAYRVNSMVFTVVGDELVIRNFWKAHTVAVPGVLAFDIGEPSNGKGQTIRVVTAVEVVPIDVFVHSVHTTRRARERLNDRHHELARWLVAYQ